MNNITPKAIIRGIEAAARLSGLHEFFLVGMATAVFTLPGKKNHKSDDADIFTPEDELRALDPIILELGEGSDFQKKEGFYIERVGSWTMLTQPEGWRERAKKIPHPTLKIRALSLLDLVYNKLEVHRPKDRAAVAEIILKAGITQEKIERFMSKNGVDPETRKRLSRRLKRIVDSIPKRPSR